MTEMFQWKEKPTYIYIQWHTNINTQYSMQYIVDEKDYLVDRTMEQDSKAKRTTVAKTKI